VKIKQEIADLKKVMAVDANRMKKGKVPIWLKSRVQKREARLKKLEEILA